MRTYLKRFKGKNINTDTPFKLTFTWDTNDSTLKTLTLKMKRFGTIRRIKQSNSSPCLITYSNRSNRPTMQSILPFGNPGFSITEEPLTVRCLLFSRAIPPENRRDWRRIATADPTADTS